MNPIDGKSSATEVSAAQVPPPQVSGPGGQRSPQGESVVLQQSRLWSRGIAWCIAGVTVAALVWAAVARLEEAVPATGKLEAQGATQEIKVPTNGVVKTVYIQDGQQVKKGEKLLSLDSSVAMAQKMTLQNIQSNLLQENALYASLMKDQVAVIPDAPILSTKPGMASLARNRTALAAENRLFQAQLASDGGRLSASQKVRLKTSQNELASRRQMAELEISQLQEQLGQADTQLAGAKDILEINQGILQDIEPLEKEGALARVQYLRQVQEVRSQQVEVDRLIQEQARLSLAIAQAQQKLSNIQSGSQKDLLTLISDNEKRIAAIDSQFSKAIIENQNRLDEIDSQLSETQQILRYQDLRSPIDGVVFDLKAAPGYVANININEPVMKVVPNRNLLAKVYIRNQDIGFVNEGMPVDVRVDSFPFSEFGDIKGKLSWLGDDALPPTEERKFVSFPAKVSLDQQTMWIKGRRVQLQSGMSVSVNIKVRDRTVISIFTDLFTRQLEPLKNVR
jgi:hemolysin D